MPLTANSKESIFLIPRSIEFGVKINIRGPLPRNHGGWGTPTPTWDLFASYVCTVDYQLMNLHCLIRMTRLKIAILVVVCRLFLFGENFMGIEYNPHPEALQVMDYKSG